MPAYFKHKGVSRFSIPRKNGKRFEFRNGLITVEDADVDEFLITVSNLPRFDQSSIVELKQLENERSLAESRAVHGAIGTADIKAPVIEQSKAAGTNPTPGLPGLKLPGSLPAI